ncbi:hypothetical protein HanXRQr2_Chr12g0558731 [Helianthus annuus]|uniref:Uncharacterized protein n=1 Tax=Helianthus annuus TaxID=4232 RepID=A0A9K3HJE4_HELAN|nr:hypothetical protein HanXRQr2_Chr12g0558731 [Helianthus annuus]KAJ0864111.1 hypothetical protein HanPSC8_Chr12g0537911 [Helianthus annuus]
MRQALITLFFCQLWGSRSRLGFLLFYFFRFDFQLAFLHGFMMFA